MIAAVRSGLVALAAALVLVTGPASAATATTEAVPLVEGSTSAARLDVPYPGHSTGFDLTATPRPGTTNDLAVLVDGGTGPLAAGPHALRLSILDGPEVVAAGTAAELSASPVLLGTLGPGPKRLRVTATLPAAAGDDLQAQRMTLRLSLVATQDLARPSDAVTLPDLARTGTSVLAVAAVALASFGLARRLRRTSTTSDLEGP